MSTQKIAELRKQIFALRAQIDRLDARPADATEVRAVIRSAVDGVDLARGEMVHAARAFALDARATHLRLNDPIGLPDLIALMGRDAVADRIFDLARPHCDGGIPSAERAAQRAKLAAELRKAELAEERAILDEFDRGNYVDRRGTASPEILIESWT
ncbi:MAG: hypothetical protein KDI51_19380 [Xanthomonadales bacterium]|nr:hypothetical protein [Xanthomonadales bacterium]